MNTGLAIPNRETPTSDHVPSAEILRGRDMLCFSHDWSGDPLSKTHLMRIMARYGRVLWVNSIGYRTPSLVSKNDLSRGLSKLMAMTTPVREVEKNLFVLNPMAVPFYGRLGQAVNSRLLRFHIRHAMRKLGFRRPLSWVFNPAAGIIAGKLGESAIIYYCVDEYTAFSGVPRANLGHIEERLLRRSDLVIVSAEALLESKAKFNPNTKLIRHGVDFAHFRKALEPATRIPEDISKLPKPIIGYFGLLASDWVNLDLLMHVARRFPQGSLVMLGKSTMDLSPLRSLSNVHLIGRKPYSSLPGYCKGFDVGLIPFPINQATLHSNPLKAREYLAAGLPVISTPIPEVEFLGHCRIAGDADSYVREIEDALEDPGPKRWRSEAFRSESWEARVDIICEHLEALGGRSSQVGLIRPCRLRCP